MAGRNFLFIPGPTNVPERILNAMHVSQEDTRAFDFPNFTFPLYRDLKKSSRPRTLRCLFFRPRAPVDGRRRSPIPCLPATRCWPRASVIFSNLFIDLCQQQKLDVQALEVDWGEGVPVEKYADILKKDKNCKIKAVLATHNETATNLARGVEGKRPTPFPSSKTRNWR